MSESRTFDYRAGKNPCTEIRVNILLGELGDVDTICLLRVIYLSKTGAFNLFEVAGH